MNIHPLWFLCIAIRILLVIMIIYSFNKRNYLNLSKFILLSIGTGFMYKAIYGSNNEIQIAKVFWHETRFYHSLFYLLAYYYLSKSNIKMCSLFLVISILFSINYRLPTIIKQLLKVIEWYIILFLK